METSGLGSDYLELGLRMGKHQKGYVDYYYGPPEIKERVDQESKIKPEQLLKDCSSLKKRVFDQGFDDKREKYLEKMLSAMEVTIERDFLGVKRPVEEDFKLQADLELRPVKESKLDDLRAQIDEAYEGAGTLSERMARMRKKRTVPESEVLKAFRKGLGITEKRTREVFPDMLPKEESIDLKADLSFQWACYEVYKGNFKSLVKVNTMYCMYWTSFLRFGAHEGYPGHHTAFAVAEDKLYRKENRFEHAILFYNTPYMIICEGIADIGLNALFSYSEQEEIALKEFCPDPKNGPPVEELIRQNIVRKNISMINFNAAYHKLVDNWSDEEAFKYLGSFEVYGDEVINNMIRKINEPVFKMVGFAQHLGRNLITNKFGEHPSPKDFRYLLENPVLPSELT